MGRSTGSTAEVRGGPARSGPGPGSTGPGGPGPGSDQGPGGHTGSGSDTGTGGGSGLPGPEALGVWRDFLRAHATLVRRLEADLLDEHALPLASYDVLVQLVEAPDHRLRMTELAERVLLSRSGLTRLVDRLVREGLVRREACPSDARGMFAVLTDAGYARLRRATPTHLRGVEEYAVGRLDDDELASLARALRRILDED